MGGYDQAWNIGAQQANERLMQRRQIGEEQRQVQQNKVGGMLLDAINQSANIKPQIKDPTTGQLIDNPAYAQAQQDRRSLLQHYVTLYSPEQHASFGERLHGLIFGKPQHNETPAIMSNMTQNASPQGAPSAAGAVGQAPAPSSAIPAPPQHPMAPPDAQTHAALSKGKELLHGLQNHLSAFAHPLPPQVQPDQALIAKYYRDPGEVEAERARTLQEIKGENALDVAQERTKALQASLTARRPVSIGQETPEHLGKLMHADPDLLVYGPDGRQMTSDQIEATPKGMVYGKYQRGANVFYSVADPKNKTINVGGQIVQVDPYGQITAENSTPLGAATSTLPKATSSTDAFGTTTSTTRSTPSTPGMTTRTVPSPAAISPPPGSAAPVVAPSPAPSSPTPQKGSTASKGSPVSVHAPTVPSAVLPPLDDNGHIPAGVGNDLVREFANNLLDGMAVKDIPNPRARAAAEALAGRYGWEQGKFTPRELNQIQEVQTILNTWRDPKAGLLTVYDENPVKRGIISDFLDMGQGKKKQGNITASLKSGLLNDDDQKFITYFNQTVGRIQALAQLTRGGGRPTDSAVRRMMSELPFPNRVSSQKDAKDAFDLIQNEIDTAMVKKQWGGPRSSNAPKLGAWKPPADAPPAPKAAGKVLKDESGNVVAKTTDGTGTWRQP